MSNRSSFSAFDKNSLLPRQIPMKPSHSPLNLDIETASSSQNMPLTARSRVGGINEPQILLSPCNTQSTKLHMGGSNLESKIYEMVRQLVQDPNTSLQKSASALRQSRAALELQEP